MSAVDGSIHDLKFISNFKWRVRFCFDFINRYSGSQFCKFKSAVDSIDLEDALPIVNNISLSVLTGQGGLTYKIRNNCTNYSGAC